MPCSTTGLLDLPLEILLEIHTLAQNPSLPLGCRGLHESLLPPCTTSTYTATYLLRLYGSLTPSAILTRALRHPICSVQVAKDIKRIWDRRRGYVEPPPTPPIQEVAEGGENRTAQDGGGDDAQLEEEGRQEETPPEPTGPALSVPELPRRVFRSLSTTHPIPPLIAYLFDTYAPNPNSHNGYPLSRAVLSKNTMVVKYLLSKGADPGIRDGLAIEIAVKLGDIGLVRLLVEHQQKNSGILEISPKWVEAAVKSGSDAIVSYFVHEKGVMPPLHSIMQLGIVLPPAKRKRQDEPRKRKAKSDPSAQLKQRPSKAKRAK